MAGAGAIVRRVDRLGRVVLPKQVLHFMDIADHDPLEVSLEDGTIVLRKHEAGCVFCGRQADLIAYRGRNVCRECALALANHVRPK